MPEQSREGIANGWRELGRQCSELVGGRPPIQELIPVDGCQLGM